MIFKDSFRDMSGWIHDFYCDKDGSELVFELDNKNYFECPVCHFKYTDEKRKRAWVTKYRYQIFDLLESYSKKYELEKNINNLAFIEDALNYYALNYDKFDIHDKTGKIYEKEANDSLRCGRITAQGLNEAMISIQIADCFDNIKFYLSKGTKDNVLNLLFPKIFELLKPQVNKVHNIQCYLICSIAIMGLVSENNEMLNYAFKSSYSIYEQLNKGVTKDYFWFEGSFHYHFFALKPILKVLKFAKKYNFAIPKKYYIMAKMMLIKGFQLSFSDCSLPSPNDSWPNRHLNDYISKFLLGNEIFNGEFDRIINLISNKKNFSKTIHAFNSGFSILKNKDWEVFIKYHDINTNHAHPDKLNIEIKRKKHFITHDLATSGYGTSISKDFYKKTYAHNTIVINGENQILESKSIIHSYNKHMINVEIEKSYNNISIARKIEIISNELRDFMIVKNKENKIVDYIFHCDAKLLTKLQTLNNNLFNEYPYLKNVKEVNISSQEINLEWILNNEIIISTIDLKNKKLFVGNSPDNPNLQDRTTLIIRSNKEDKIIFKVMWKIA